MKNLKKEAKENTLIMQLMTDEKKCEIKVWMMFLVRVQVPIAHSFGFYELRQTLKEFMNKIALHSWVQLNHVCLRQVLYCKSSLLTALLYSPIAPSACQKLELCGTCNLARRCHTNPSSWSSTKLP